VFFWDPSQWQHNYSHRILKNSRINGGLRPSGLWSKWFGLVWFDLFVFSALE
jgi:hypothetical protein